MRILTVKTTISERKSKSDGPNSRQDTAEENIIEFG